MSTAHDVNENQEPYFEKQTRFLCGVHALNNLFGKPEFSVAEMDSFAKTAGTQSIVGYYDVSTLQLAIDSRGYDLTWFDLRKDVTELPFLDTLVVGFLLNSSTPLLYFFKSRHWKCVRIMHSIESNGTTSYLAIDSKAKKPVKLDFDGIVTFMGNEKRSGAQILVVRKIPSNQMEDDPKISTEPYEDV